MSLSCKALRKSGRIAVVGAGPAGLTLAHLPRGRGFMVTVYERDASPTARTQGGSLDLRENDGQRALDAAGLLGAFLRTAREEAKAFRMLDEHGDEQSGAGGDTHEDAGPEIDRGDLRSILLGSLPAEAVVWGRSVAAVEPADEGRWRLTFKEGKPVVADLVIGADGAGSKVRRRLTPVQPTYTGITMVAANVRRDLWRGSKLSETLGEGSVMYAGRNKTVFVQRCAHDVILLYYSLAVEQDWPKSRGFSLNDREAVLSAVRQAYADWPTEILAMLTEVEGDFQDWPISTMPPDHRWRTQAGLAMVGDASHVMPPFTGKGVNLALLDALELADVLTARPEADLAEAVGAFERGMQARTAREIGECLVVGRQIYGIDIDFGRVEAA